MKVLFLVRHGQSGWDDVKLADRDRPLTDKDVNLPTCAVAVLRFDIKSWARIGRKKLEKVAIKYA
ncbi:hypothetical protein D3C81_2152690 [compost metagenome]